MTVRYHFESNAQMVVFFKNAALSARYRAGKIKIGSKEHASLIGEAYGYEQAAMVVENSIIANVKLVSA